MRDLDPEELMKLPNYSVVLDLDRNAYQKLFGSWFMPLLSRKLYAHELVEVAPLTLLYSPEEK